MNFHATIRVNLKRDVADVQGMAIQQALAGHGKPVVSVHAGKVFDVVVDAASREEAERIARELADGTFSNAVIEDFTIEVK